MVVQLTGVLEATTCALRRWRRPTRVWGLCDRPERCTQAGCLTGPAVTGAVSALSAPEQRRGHTGRGSSLRDAWCPSNRIFKDLRRERCAERPRAGRRNPPRWRLLSTGGERTAGRANRGPWCRTGERSRAPAHTVPSGPSWT